MKRKDSMEAHAAIVVRLAKDIRDTDWPVDVLAKISHIEAAIKSIVDEAQRRQAKMRD